MIVCGDRFSMHMVDPWVLKGHAIKLLTFHIKGTLLSASMDSGVMDVLQHKIWLNG